MTIDVRPASAVSSARCLRTGGKRERHLLDMRKQLRAQGEYDA